MKLKTGDIVKWKSQSQGHPVLKEGFVIEVVKAGWWPKKYKPNGGSMGYPRPETSYVVRVGKSRTYWPKVCQFV